MCAYGTFCKLHHILMTWFCIYFQTVSCFPILFVNNFDFLRLFDRSNFSFYLKDFNLFSITLNYLSTLQDVFINCYWFHRWTSLAWVGFCFISILNDYFRQVERHSSRDGEQSQHYRNHKEPSYGEDNTSRRQINVVTRGVPQGSVLGPLFWKLYYDGVFRAYIPPSIVLIGYADDLALVATAGTGEELRKDIDIEIEHIEMWMVGKGLQIEPRKTEVVLLGGRRKLKEIEIGIQGSSVKSQKHLKYLEVVFDKDMRMTEHAKQVTKPNGNTTCENRA